MEPVTLLQMTNTTRQISNSRGNRHSEDGWEGKSKWDTLLTGNIVPQTEVIGGVPFTCCDQWNPLVEAKRWSRAAISTVNDLFGSQEWALFHKLVSSKGGK